MKKTLFIIGAAWVSLGAFAGEVSFAPGVSFHGSPSYVSEFATRMRDNGGPLSPFGSHFGLKAEVRTREFAGVEHYACATGRNVLDYSRTGLMGTSSVGFIVDGARVREARQRRIGFEYFGWEEVADFPGFEARARVTFLGLDQYAIIVGLRSISDESIEIVPLLYFTRKGRSLSLMRRSRPDELVARFSVQPTLTRGENFLAILPSAGTAIERGTERGSFHAQTEAISLEPGEERWVWFIFGYSPDDAGQALDLARGASEAFRGPEDAWQGMLETRDDFFNSLPAPHLDPGEDDYLDLYRMSAVALENALYAPRGEMNHWACVPTKVHYNWFWLWDTGFQALGYSEFRPEMARETVLAMFQAQRPDGFISHMTDERARPLTPHSQPPVFGFSAQRMISRHPDNQDWMEFERIMYERGKPFLAWWEEHRDKNHNGLFEYMSQDEGGWDNSPRANYVPPLVFISYYGYLGEILGSQVKPLDNVDLNSWMYLYYRAMERWAQDLGKPEQARQWRDKALTLAARIDQVLWDPESGCWLDAYGWRSSPDVRHFRVITPAAWFPAFAGATLDEEKAREAIERHLLNPDEFFGQYPIPTVAYNDPYFDNTRSGWTASVWLVTAYSALEALFRFGYEREADELRSRLLAMMADQDGMKAIYETYDPETGRYKNEYSDGGYSSAQFGWSAAFTMEMVLERHQEERFIFSGTTAIRGHIRRAEDFYSREPYYRVEAGLDVPLVELKSADRAPLLGAGSVAIKLTDPYQALSRRSFTVWLRDQSFEVETGREYLLDLD